MQINYRPANFAHHYSPGHVPFPTTSFKIDYNLLDTRIPSRFVIGSGQAFRVRFWPAR